MRIVWILGAVLGLLILGDAESNAQAVAFQPVVGSFPNGVTMSATPVVSHDRRYVRLTVNPQFNALLGLDPFLIPGAVSGGGGGPGGMGGGGGGVAGIAGIAGMNGPVAGAGQAAVAQAPAIGGRRIAVDAGPSSDPFEVARARASGSESPRKPTPAVRRKPPTRRRAR